VSLSAKPFSFLSYDLSPHARLWVQTGLVVAAFFFSFVWDQRFNLTSGLLCLACMTLAVGLQDGARMILTPYRRVPVAWAIILVGAVLLVWTWARAWTSDIPSSSVMAAGFYTIPLLMAYWVITLPPRVVPHGAMIGVGGLIAVVAVCATAIAIEGDITGTYFRGLSRVDWPMQSSNHLAMIMNAGILMGVGLCIQARLRRWGLALLVLCLLGSVATGSRAGNLTLVLGLAVLAVMVAPLWWPHRRRVALYALGLVLLAGVFMAWRWQAVDMVAGYGGLVSNLTQSSGGRPLMWLATLHLALERPLLGYGTGTFLFVYPQLMTPQHITAGFAAHNDWLQIFMELGAVGALLYAGLGLAVVVAAVKATRNGTSPSMLAVRATSLAVMLTLALHAQIEFMLMVLPTSMLFGLALGAFVTTLRGPEVGEDDTQSRRQVWAGHAVAALLVVLSTLSILQTQAQVQAEKSNAAIRTNQLDTYVDASGWASTLSMDLIAIPYLLTAQYQVAALTASGGMVNVDPDDVQKNLDAARVRNPYQASLFIVQGQLDQLQGRSPEPAWREGLRLEPRHADLRLLLLRYYERLGRAADAQALAKDSQAWLSLSRGQVGALAAALRRYEPVPQGAN
jgi:O-antigen ligase